eukprot:Gb_32321 [translate_table: standard]
MEKSSQGNREFEAEGMTIGTVHHMNLVRLLGYCTQGVQHRLLVYEFMENGSLDKHIFGGEENNNRAILSWQTRFNVALGVAKGVAYCDEQCQSRIVHFDLKPENVLLDSQLQPKVSDFGLAKLMSKDQSCTVTNMRGTIGYLAPEWLADLPITVKVDVYSYDQMLMEIISGRKNLVTTVSLDRLYYPLWAFQEMIKGNISNVVDERLGDEFDFNQLELLLKVTFWCIQDESSSRTSMGAVVRMIQVSLEVLMPPPPKTLSLLIAHSPAYHSSDLILSIEQRLEFLSVCLVTILK